MSHRAAVPEAPPVHTPPDFGDGVDLDWLGGNCPVQAEGSVDGKRFYFRARGEEWQFHVAATDADIFDNDLFYHEQDYGDGPFAAGWMPVDEAVGFIRQGIAMYRASLTPASNREPSA